MIFRGTGSPQSTDLDSIRGRVRADLLGSLDVASEGDELPEAFRGRCENAVRSIVDRIAGRTDEETKETLVAELLADVVGLGPLEPLLADDAISDVLVSAPDRIQVERSGRLEDVDVRFRDESHLRQVVHRLVRRAGRRLDERNPMVDARLPGGARINVVIPPLAIDGTQLSIRRFAKTPFDLAAFVRLGMLPPATASLLGAAIAGRLNVAVTGGAGSGKTTLLGALSAFIGDRERVVTIEDVAELRMVCPGVVRLETRESNLEGIGRVDARALVRNALRMRPDRIIVGECRGPEVFDMLQAMNTGHAGSMTTLHANSPRHAMLRLESMLAMSELDVPRRAMQQYLGSSLDLLVHLERLPDGRRVVAEVAEVRGGHDGGVVLETLHRHELQDVDDRQARGRFVSTGTTPEFLEVIRSRGVELDLRIFAEGVQELEGDVRAA